jgi:recombination protein RecR
MKDLKSLNRLIDCFVKLPGVGRKSAERMAYAVLAFKKDDVNEFIASLQIVNDKIHPCPTCGIYTEHQYCEICQDKSRNHQTMIVISYPKDVYAFEKIENHNHVYHVLGGVLSATQGVGIEDLSIDKLVDRIKNEKVKEIILATDPTIEGETTALFIAKLLDKLPVQVSRLAYGLPMGGHLDYADSLTLSKSLIGRTKMKGDK